MNMSCRMASRGKGSTKVESVQALLAEHFRIMGLGCEVKQVKAKVVNLMILVGRAGRNN